MQRLRATSHRVTSYKCALELFISHQWSVGQLNAFFFFFFEILRTTDLCANEICIRKYLLPFLHIHISTTDAKTIWMHHTCYGRWRYADGKSIANKTNDRRSLDPELIARETALHWMRTFACTRLSTDHLTDCVLNEFIIISLIFIKYIM